MATYKKFEKDGYKVQVESAIRDGEGKNIVNNYAKQDGYYQNMAVGIADNLQTSLGLTGTDSFVFQSSGGSADIQTGTADFNALRGNSVAFNQLVDSDTSSLDLTSGHIYKTIIGGVESIVTGAGETINVTGGVDQVFDLTLMFGDGNEPESVVGFNRLFPLPYYEYNAGQLLSSKSNAYKIVGYNACNGVFQIRPNDTLNRCLESQIIPAIAGKTYVLEKPSFTDYQYRHLQVVDEDGTVIRQLDEGLASNNVIELTLSAEEHYLRVQYWYYENNHYTSVPSAETLNTCVHLKWSGSKTGYEKYYTETYTLPNIELRSAGSAYDELKYEGTLITRIGVIDLGTLSWVYDSRNMRFYSSSAVSDMVLITDSGILQNLICSKYQNVHQTNVNGNAYTNVISSYNGRVYIADTNYTDTATFKTSLSGVYLYYELATPVSSVISGSFTKLTKIDDYGTQEFLSEQTIQVPQCAEFFYQYNLRNFIQRAYTLTGGNVNDFVTESELTTALSGIEPGFKVINAPSSTTLTDEQISLISKGVRIDGDFLGFHNPILIPYGSPSYNVVYGIAIGVDTSTGRVTSFKTYYINTQTKVISASYTFFDLNSYNGTLSIKGKALPSYPSSPSVPQVLTYGTNNTLSWENSGMFNVINASDIVSNTLTADQYALITNGKPTLISGTLLGIRNPILTSPYEGGGSFIYGLKIGQTSTGYQSLASVISQFRINVSTKLIETVEADKRLSIEQLNTLNGKNLPSYPSSTGTFVLKCVNGVLTWVEE